MNNNHHLHPSLARAEAAASRPLTRLKMLAADSTWCSTSLLIVLEVLMLACLLIVGLRLTAGLESVVDLGLYDETGYLYAGTHLPNLGLMPPAWAPLYGAWYFAISHLQPDPVGLYYLNYRILSIGTPLLLYLLLRAYRLPRPIALAAAWAFLACFANLPIWPKPGNLALCLTLLLLLAARDLRAPTRSVLLLSLGALLCAYVRPEYLLSSALLFGLYLLLLWSQRAQLRLRVELAQLSLALAAAFGLIFAFGLWVNDPNNDRTFEAFSQHFAFNWVQWNQSPLDPWTEHQQVMNSAFGPATSVGEALRANPQAVARHALTNIAGYPGAFAKTFLLHSSPLLRPAAQQVALAIEWLLGLGAAGALAWAVARHPALLWERLCAERLRLTIFATLAVPALVSAVVVYPRTHYLLLHGVLLVLSAGLLLPAPRAGWRRGAGLSAVAAVALVALTPTLVAAEFMPTESPYPHPNRSTVEAVRGLGLHRATGVLGDDGGLSYYFGEQFRRVGAEPGSSPPLAFIAEHDIGLILIPAQRGDPRPFAEDRAWQALLDNPSSAGFTSLAAPGTGRVILYRAEP